ncbi:MAG: hypothetical protein WEB56_07450 [Roseovarius sp.]
MDDTKHSGGFPEMVMPKRDADCGPQAYDEIAKAYLLAAELLWKRAKDEPNLPIIAPLSLNMGLGLELFLKARLLERGYTHKRLSSRTEFGHNIHKMWMMDEFTEMRRHAQKYAEACVSAKRATVRDPTRFTIDWTVEYLGRLYSTETHYALRYPQGKTQVPYAQPLLWVMYELVDDPRWCITSQFLIDKAHH